MGRMDAKVYLKYGYPAVIVVSALVILICLLIMNKEKFW